LRLRIIPACSPPPDAVRVSTSDDAMMDVCVLVVGMECCGDVYIRVKKLINDFCCYILEISK
jgi:hypothetical protein